MNPHELPTPSFDETMRQLERMIHQWDDDDSGREGYHPDALWLEEVRHHVRRFKREAAAWKGVAEGLYRSHLEDSLNKRVDSLLDALEAFDALKAEMEGRGE